MALERKYGSILYRDHLNKWIVDDLEPHVMMKIKDIFRQIPRTATGPLFFDHTPETAVELEWFMKRYPLRIIEKDKNFMELERDAHIETMNTLERIMSSDYVAPEMNLKKPLRHYQTVAVQIHEKVKGILIGDDLGLGKTVTGIGTFSKEKLPAVVVVQAHLPKQWREKIEEFTDLKVHCIKGTRPYSLPPADVYILKYSCLAGWLDYFKQRPFKSAILDEIQELRKTDSLKYRAAKWLTKHVDYVMGLSATPIYNYGDEIWAVMNVIKEGCLGPLGEFLREWCQGKEVKDPKALGAYLRENFLFLRRTRSDVKMELPKVNRLTYTVAYDEAAIEKMERVASELAIKVMTGTFVERGQASRELDIMVRYATGVSKAKPVAEFVRVLLESGEPVLLAGWHRDVYEIWQKELMEFKPVMYTGSESASQKDQAKNDFIDGKSNLMMISLRSGIGLDGLQKRCKFVVFGELDWSPQVQEQVIGRLNRDGQEAEEGITAIYLVSDSGSDPMMVDLLGLKASQAKGIVDPFSGVEIKHSDESRIKELAQRIIKKRHGANSPIQEVV